MRQLLVMFAVLMTVFATSATAQQNKPVVELFTSQGCSSCPPADALLTDLAGRDDVIALALHVDYWDYIGWRDIFGDAAYTQRQQAYARAAGATTVYTPQMVIGGRDHVVGTKPMQVMDLISQHKRTSAQIALAVQKSGQTLRISATKPAGRVEPMVVQLVRYKPEEVVAIERGENAGRSIKYSNIVRSWQNIALWDGSTDLNIAAQAPGSDAIVVIVQQDAHGPIIAAVELR